MKLEGSFQGAGAVDVNLPGTFRIIKIEFIIILTKGDAIPFQRIYWVVWSYIGCNNFNKINDSGNELFRGNYACCHSTSKEINYFLFIILAKYATFSKEVIMSYSSKYT